MWNEIQQKFSQFESTVRALEDRFTQVDGRLESLEEKFKQMESKIDLLQVQLSSKPPAPNPSPIAPSIAQPEKSKSSTTIIEEPQQVQPTAKSDLASADQGL